MTEADAEAREHAADRDVVAPRTGERLANERGRDGLEDVHRDDDERAACSEGAVEVREARVAAAEAADVLFEDVL